MTDKVRLVFSFTALSAGIAIFSMFFGAGNVIYPLSLGQHVGEHINYAMLGMMLTAIGGPLLGLFSTILFDGDCKKFFSRIGDIPAYLLVILIIAVIGPFGAMPRCITVAHSAMLPYFPDLSLLSFSIISGLLTLLCIYKRDLILPILGVILSPLLLISLAIIIAVGMMSPENVIPTDYTKFDALLAGIMVGYDTMDILASMFFAVIIWDLLKEKFTAKNQQMTPQNLAPVCFMASIIGGGLLGLVYVGLSLVAAGNMDALAGVPKEALLTALSIYLLGAKYAFIANIAIALACLTTVLSLAATVADVVIVEFKNSKVGNGRILNYNVLVLIIVAVTVVFSNLGFANIMAYLHPIMEVCYPAVIVLAICNILYRMFNFPWVKFPVYLTFVASLMMHIYTRYLI